MLDSGARLSHAGHAGRLFYPAPRRFAGLLWWRIGTNLLQLENAPKLGVVRAGKTLAQQPRPELPQRNPGSLLSPEQPFSSATEIGREDEEIACVIPSEAAPPRERAGVAREHGASESRDLLF